MIYQGDLIIHLPKFLPKGGQLPASACNRIEVSRSGNESDGWGNVGRQVLGYESVCRGITGIGLKAAPAGILPLFWVKRFCCDGVLITKNNKKS
jgi:hypothetical protein